MSTAVATVRHSTFSSMPPDDPFALTRRHFCSRFGLGLGSVALASLLPRDLGAAAPASFPNFPAKAKRIIYLFMSGGPAQQDLFDYKPKLRELNGQPIPPEVLGQQRLTGMSAGQSIFPLAGSQFDFAQHGKSGAWFSSLVPKLAGVADDLCFVKSMWTEAGSSCPWNSRSFGL